MKIIASAIKFYLTGSPEYPMIMTGKRHGDIFARMFNMGINYEKKTAIQGFLTNTNRFVNRKEAKQIAIENNLLLDSASSGEELFSEDIW